MFQKIRQMMLEGLSQAEIARKLELNPKTVGRYARSNTPPQYKARDGSTRADEFMVYREKVESWVLRTPLLTDREVYELLLPESCAGSERVVQLHFGTLPFSDACLVRGYPLKNYECFIDGVHEFFQAIGGMTKNGSVALSDLYLGRAGLRSRFLAFTLQVSRIDWRSSLKYPSWTF